MMYAVSLCISIRGQTCRMFFCALNILYVVSLVLHHCGYTVRIPGKYTVFCVAVPLAHALL